MTTGNHVIELHFAGDGIRPENVKAGEIADVIQGVERMVESCIERDHPNVDLGQVLVGLVEIQGSSISLKFKSQVPDAAIPAFRVIGEAIANNDFSQLPDNALDALDNIASFNRRRQCTADLILNNGDRRVLATMTPLTQIARLPLLSGDTIIYGQVVRVGGREPRVMVETIDGHILYCDTTIDVAKKLGERLYRKVGLFGLASWDARTLALQQFIINDVTSYEDIPLEEAIRQLGVIAGQYYNDVSDVDGYIANMRGSPSEAGKAPPLVVWMSHCALVTLEGWWYNVIHDEESGGICKRVS